MSRGRRVGVRGGGLAGGQELPGRWRVRDGHGPSAEDQASRQDRTEASSTPPTGTDVQEDRLLQDRWVRLGRRAPRGWARGSRVGAAGRSPAPPRPRSASRSRRSCSGPLGPRLPGPPPTEAPGLGTGGRGDPRSGGPGGDGAPPGGQRPRPESPPRPLGAGHAALASGVEGQGASDRCGRPGGGRRRGVGVPCSAVWCGSSAADLVPGTRLSRHPQGPRRDPTPRVTAGARGDPAPPTPACAPSGTPPPPAADAGGVIAARSLCTWPRTWPQTTGLGATPGPNLLLGELGGPAWDRVALLASVTCKPSARLEGRRPGHYEGPRRWGLAGLASQVRSGAGPSGEPAGGRGSGGSRGPGGGRRWAFPSGAGACWGARCLWGDAG